jgi:hypothetical protein
MLHGWLIAQLDKDFGENFSNIRHYLNALTRFVNEKPAHMMDLS